MPEHANQDRVLRTIARLLIWAFMISMLGLVFWFTILTLAGDWVYQFHTRLIPVTRDNFWLVHYGGMMLLKIGIFSAFLAPYLAIRVVIWRDRQSGQEV